MLLLICDEAEYVEFTFRSFRNASIRFTSAWWACEAVALMGLRAKVVRGGAYLFLRQGLGVAIGAVGIILLTRTIGPGAYGIYAAALGIYFYVFNLAKMGTDVYLVRREGEVQLQDYHQAFSLLLLTSCVGAGLAFLALPLIEHWVLLEGFGSVALALFAGLPITLVGRVPLARLERALDYRSVAMIELSAQVVFYGVALTLAYKGLGPWAPVGGWWAQEFLRLVLLYWLSGYRPRLYWESTRVRAMTRYGLGFSASVWIWMLRYLVNPLIVGRYAGADAVGYVALSIRLVEQLSFVKEVAWRLSIAVLARLQEDRTRLVNAVTEGMNLQTIASGGPLVVFSIIAPWVVPIVFGTDWLEVLEVYPFIALSYLSNAMFQMHTSALYVLRRNWNVAVFYLVHIILFVGSALLLVPHLGLKGYGWAEVAALPSYLILHIWITAYIGRLRYVEATIWFIAWTVALFSPQLGPWAGISVIAPLILSTTRKSLLQIIVTIGLSSRRRQ